VAAAVLSVLDLGSIIFDEEADLFGKRPGAGKVCKKIPDARSFMLVLPHGALNYNAGNISIDRETFLIPQSWLPLLLLPHFLSEPRSSASASPAASFTPLEIR
jgi:hypothetical protein